MSGNIDGDMTAVNQDLEQARVQMAQPAADERAELQAQMDELKANIDIVRSIEETMHDVMLDATKNISVDLSDHAHDGDEVVAYADDASADGWATHAHDTHDEHDATDAHDTSAAHDVTLDAHHADAAGDDGASA